MEDFKTEFAAYLKDIANNKPNNLKDTLSKSHYFNSKVNEKYAEFLRSNPQYTETQLKISTSDIRVKYQIEFVR